jgi:hypothetical protein
MIFERKKNIKGGRVRKHGRSERKKKKKEKEKKKEN